MKLDKLFCVIDPTTNHQTTLERATFLARNGSPSIHAFLCFTPPTGTPVADDAAFRAAEQKRHELWLEDLVTPLRDEGCRVTTETVCSNDWREGISTAVAEHHADLTIKAAHRRSPLQRRFLKTSDWVVLRDAKTPVLFVKRPQPGAIKRVLAAVNIAATDAPHQGLTDLVIAEGHDVATTLGAELHVVNAYYDSKNFIHPPDLAKRVGLPRAQCHVGDGAPEAVIAATAEKIAADLVIIGSVGRKGMAAAVVGNTAERILDSVDADILTVFRPSAA